MLQKLDVRLSDISAGLDDPLATTAVLMDSRSVAT
jgi:hypothetical protein